MATYSSNIWKMYLFTFFNNMFLVGGVLMPFFLEWGNISFLQVMLLQSFFVISVFLLEIPTGAVADYFGRKTSMIIAGLFATISPIVYSISPSYLLFFVAEFLWALSYTLASGADSALLYDTLKKIKKEKTSKRVFSKNMMFQMLGLTIGAPIGGFIAATFGLKYAMMAMVVPMAISSLIGFTFKEPKITKKVESTRYLNLLLKGVKYFKNHKILKILAFDLISIQALVFFIIWTYQPILRDLGITLILLSMVSALLTAAEIFVLNYFEWFERLLKSKKSYLLWSALISGIAFILLGLSNNIRFSVVMVVIIAGFGLTRRILFQSYMNKHIKKSEIRATVMSTVSMIESFVRAILYPIIGLLVAWSMNYAIMIVGFAIIVSAFISRVKEEHLID